MSSKTVTSGFHSEVAKNASNEKSPAMKDDVKKQRLKRADKNQQEVKDSEMPKSAGEPDVEAITEESDVDVENVPSIANLATETHMNDKPTKIAKKMSKSTKQEHILETEFKNAVSSDETIEENVKPSNSSDSAKVNMNKTSEDVTNDGVGDAEAALSKGKPKNVQPKKKTQKPQPPNAGDASSNEEKPTTVENLEMPKQKPKKTKDVKKTQEVSQPSNTADDGKASDGDSEMTEAALSKGKPKNVQPKKNTQKSQPSNDDTTPNEKTSQTDEDLVGVLAKESEKDQKTHLPQSSNAADVSPDKGKIAIDEDSEMVLDKGEATKAKPDEKVQMPQTSNAPDDDFEGEKPKVEETNQTKNDPESGASCSQKEKAPKPLDRSILQLKIVLRHAVPPIWRRIQVLNNDTFIDLHYYIKEAMGWLSPAGHQFITADPEKKSTLLIVDGSCKGVLYDFNKPHLLNGETTMLSKFLNAKDDHILYEFDWAEAWLHDIIVEKVLPPPPPETEYPKCLGGKRACPPADCGGVDGYNHLMEVYNDPNHSEYEELIVDWLGDQEPGWDPEKFNKRKVYRNVDLAVLFGPFA